MPLPVRKSLSVRKPLSDRRPWLAVARAWGAVLRTRTRLPPGELIDIGEHERAHRRLLIDLAARHGPIFKGLMERKLVVCVVGHSLGRRLLKEHAASLSAVSIALESLFAHGFMRKMEGETHRRYRRALVQGLYGLDPKGCTARFEAIAAQALSAHADGDRMDGDRVDGDRVDGDRVDGAAPVWADTLAHIAASALITFFFGPQPGSAGHQRLMAAYRRLGPHGVVWQITGRQAEAYRALVADVQALGPEAGGLLGRLQAQEHFDETLLGNLIYMVELGRYDLRGLMRWVSRYAADHPAWLERIALERLALRPADGGATAAEAFVQETLRMDQSERLMREVRRDIVFDGWLIPRGSLVRVCLWEAHKDPQAFAQPFEFDPGRFLGGASQGDRFSPFGLDHHHCPLAAVSVQIAVAFLRALARDYALRAQGADPAVRGPYHWEPSPRFQVSLTHRVSARS
ncbi:MAG: cytochrome P450 [Burkholderiaceae bacterium]|nr:cytochrome P450 [Burkholderiaceae bacterium]